MKLIDWTKLPRGTMTNKGEIICIHKEGREALIFDGNMTFWKENDFLRIVPATRWTYHDGGECPVPYGLSVDVIGRNGEILKGRATHHYRWEYTDSGDDYYSDVIAYRITGVDRAGGFTDCPDEVTE